jgi:hypothetical protein
MPPTDFGFGPLVIVVRMLAVGLEQNVSSSAELATHCSPLQYRQSPQTVPHVPQLLLSSTVQVPLQQMPVPELQISLSVVEDGPQPELGSQVWQSGHETGVPVHTPLTQVSAVVQASPSSHGTPSSGV